MQDFRKLQIYRRSVEYCTDIYKFSCELPKSEQYGLTAQIRSKSSLTNVIARRPKADEAISGIASSRLGRDSQ